MDLRSLPAEDGLVLWKVLATVPSKESKDVLTGAMVLGDVTVMFSRESGGLRNTRNMILLLSGGWVPETSRRKLPLLAAAPRWRLLPRLANPGNP